MTQDLPTGPGGEPANDPPARQWAPAYATAPTRRPRTWLAVATAAVAALVAGAALIVSLGKPTASISAARSTTPSYSAADAAAAQRQLCDTYKLVARAVDIDTNGNDRALARIADTNGAVMLDMAAANPALDPTHRDNARALAAAYATVTAMGNSVVATDAQYRAALDDVIAKDIAMKQACGGS